MTWISCSCDEARMTQKVFHQYFWMKPTTARPATTTTMTTPTARPAPTTTTTSEATAPTATNRQEFLWQMPGQVEQLLGLSFRPNEMLETISSEQNSEKLYFLLTQIGEKAGRNLLLSTTKNCNFFLQHLIPFWRHFFVKKNPKPILIQVFLTNSRLETYFPSKVKLTFFAVEMKSENGH